MTHILGIVKTQFAAIEGGVLPFLHVPDKGYTVGETLIFQHEHSEKAVEITHLYQSDGVKNKWVCIAWKEKDY